MKSFKYFVLEYTSPFKVMKKGDVNTDPKIVRQPKNPVNSNMPEIKSYTPDKTQYSIDDFGKKHAPLVFSNTDGKSDLEKETIVNTKDKKDLPTTTIYKNRK